MMEQTDWNPDAWRRERLKNSGNSKVNLRIFGPGSQNQNSYNMDLKTAISTLTAGIVGVGVIQMPMAMQHAGFVGGFMIMIMVALMSYLGGYYIGLAGRMTGRSEIDTMAKASAGALGQGLAIFAQLGMCLAASIAYIICWYKMLAPILKSCVMDPLFLKEEPLRALMVRKNPAGFL